MTHGAPIRARPTRVVAVLAGLAVAAQFWGLYRLAGPPTPSAFPQADKVEHALGFALPAALVLLTLGWRALDRGVRPGPRAAGVALALFAAHAVVSEVVQDRFYAGRTGDPLDVVADLVGLVLGALAAGALLRRSSGAGTDREVATGRPPVPAENSSSAP